MNEAEIIARVSSLVGVVRRTYVLRHTVRVAIALSIALGVLCVATTVLVPDLPRAVYAVPFVLSLLGAFVFVMRRRPSELSFVWYVDRALSADELVLTAYDGALRGVPDDALVRAVSKRLANVSPKDVRPRRMGREVFGLPYVGALVALVVVWPHPRRVVPVADQDVRIAVATELDAIERLPRLTVAERPALERAAREARALRAALREGLTAREAVDRVERLREQVANVRSAETPRQRRAREAAIEALSGERSMADALAAHDLEALSRAVERAAASRESADRERARASLRQAAEAARREGDDALAESLLSRERLLRERAEQAALARELAEAMPEMSGARMRRALETLAREGSSQALDRAMVEAMRDAWQRLSPEERQRLAEAMSRAQAARNDANGQSAESPQGQQDPRSADDIERQLREALANLDHLQMRVGAGGMPAPGGRGSAQARGGQGQGNGSGSGQGSGQGGGRGGGPGGTPEGSTATLEGDPLLARVRPLERAGAPAESFTDWVDPSQPVDPSALPTPGGVGAAGDANAVTRARVPEEYREHVRTYFGGGH